MSLCVLAARAARIAVLDGVHNDLDAAEEFAQACVLARDFGFDGKSLIHPSHLEICNRAFAPPADEVAWAGAVVEAFGPAFVYESARSRWRLAEALAEAGRRDEAGRRRNRDRDAEVEPGAALGQAGRGQPDRDLALGPLFVAIDDRGVDPVPCLPQRGVGQADQDHPDQPVGDVDLDLDHVAGHAHQGDRGRAGQRHG